MNDLPGGPQAVRADYVASLTRGLSGRCYDARLPTEATKLARAKSTERAEARRRHRAALAEQRRLEEEAADAERATDPEDEVAAAEPARRSFLQLPDFRGDVAALPGILRQKRLVWLVVAAMVAALLLGIAGARGLFTDPTALAVTAFFVQTMLYPPALVPAFVAGFLVPRGSWLVGLLIGVIDAILLLILGTFIPGFLGAEGTGIISVAAVAILSGGLIGAFASWYRDFLQKSAQRRRAVQEERARQRKRDERAKRPGRSPAR
jgi:hypothetical protein